MFTLDKIYKLDFSAYENLFLINDFVSELVPVFHSSPYRIEKGDTVESLYKRFMEREIGGWCGLTTSFMLMLLKECGVSAEVYNYGIRGTEFTHTIIIANDYPLDPYFNRCYIDTENTAMKFDVLLQKIKNRDFSFLSMYSTLSVKTKRIDKEEGYEFISLTGQEWEESLMESWEKKSFNEALKTEFGDVNPYLLMLRSV